MAGMADGTTIRRKMAERFRPKVCPASMSSWGTEALS
jgi:hypothetical protein